MSTIYYPDAVEKWRSLALKYSTQYKVPVDVILGTIKKESMGNPDAFNGQSNENSRGLMQMSEKTALTHEAVLVPFMLLDKLYDPDYNIQNGTALLSWLYGELSSNFDRSMSERDKWIVVSSSYNQGHKYYVWALETIKERGENFTWENILHNVLNPTKTTRTPWVNSAKTYGPSIIGPISETSLQKPMNIFLLAAAGIVLSAGSFYILKRKL